MLTMKYNLPMQNAAPIQTVMISAISNACKVKLNCSTKHGAEKNSNKNRPYPAWSFSLLPFQYQMANSAVKPARKNINSKRAFSINGIKRSIPNNFPCGACTAFRAPCAVIYSDCGVHKPKKACAAARFFRLSHGAQNVHRTGVQKVGPLPHGGFPAHQCAAFA